MRLTKEQIENINRSVPYEQGIFVQGYGVPVHIKGPCLYTKYEIGGTSGGSCWNDSDPRPYTVDPPQNKWKILDTVLEVLRPNITLLEFRKIEELIRNNRDRNVAYYGNSTDYMIEYIELEELYALLNTMP